MVLCYSHLKRLRSIPTSITYFAFCFHGCDSKTKKNWLWNNIQFRMVSSWLLNKRRWDERWLEIQLVSKFQVKVLGLAYVVYGAPPVRLWYLRTSCSKRVRKDMSGRILGWGVHWGPRDIVLTFCPLHLPFCQAQPHNPCPSLPYLPPCYH